MSFLVRRVSYHANPLQADKSELQITVEPNKVIFDHIEHNKINISKLVIHNQSRQEVNFSISQPKQPCLRVRFQKTSIPSQSSVEIFVFLNSQNLLKTINDQFVITITKEYSIYVPIQIKNQFNLVQRNRKSSFFTAKIKENNLPMKTGSRSRLIMRGDRRKNAAMLESKEGDEIDDLIGVFLKKYKKIESFLKQKMIKNQIFVGEKPITKEKHHNILNFNLRMELIADEKDKNKILSRHKQEFSEDGPSVQNFKQVKPRWDMSRNQPQITLNKGMNKFMEEVRKIVINYRFKKMHRVMQIYRQLDDELNTVLIQSVIIPNMMLDGNEQLKESINSIKFGEEDEDEKIKKQEYICKKIKKNMRNKAQCKLGIDFNEFTLMPRLLEQDHRSNMSRREHIYDIKPLVGFDNWVSLQESTPYIHELLQYEKVESLNIWECHPIVQEHCDLMKFKGSKAVSQSKMRRVAPNSKVQLFTINDRDLQNDDSELEEFQNVVNSSIQYYKTPLQMCPTQQVDSHLLFEDRKGQMKPYSEVINPIHTHQQYFQSFYTSQDRQIMGILPFPNPDLIYEPEREDKIDFDELNALSRRKMEKLIEKEKRGVAEFEEAKLEEVVKEKKGQQFSVVYERLLNNIEKIKLRKLNVSFNRLMWLNNMTRKASNMLYF